MTDASLLPPNATPVQRAFAQMALKLLEIPVPIRDVWNADTCPLALLPWLAWALGLRQWNTDWPEAVRRSFVRNALAIARRKGTRQSVVEVVQAFGGAIAVREWFEQDPPGQPHTFSVVLTLDGQSGEPATARFVDEVVAEIERTKPVRAHFTFTQGLSFAGTVRTPAAIRPIVIRRVELEQAA
jgi:phage tail protein, P2 protein I family